jgi:hypothetical protein
MRAGTTIPYPYIGDLYGYILTTSADGTVTQRDYDVVPKQIRMLLNTNLLGELVIQSQSKMQINSYLKNIVDANGDEIYTGGEWQITQTAPILGQMGLKSGYQYRAKLIAGEI